MRGNVQTNRPGSRRRSSMVALTSPSAGVPAGRTDSRGVTGVSARSWQAVPTAAVTASMTSGAAPASVRGRSAGMSIVLRPPWSLPDQLVEPGFQVFDAPVRVVEAERGLGPAEDQVPVGPEQARDAAQDRLL